MYNRCRRRGAGDGPPGACGGHQHIPGCAAACLCLLIGTATAFAAAGFGTRLFTTDTSPDPDFRESGFDLSVEIERIPMDAFTGEIREVSDVIVRQFENYQPWSSQYPGGWKKDFSSSADARAYIGFDPLKALDWDLEEGNTMLLVRGDSSGQIQYIQLETDYTAGDIRLQAFSHMYTECYDSEITVGGRTTEYVEFTETFYTTESRKQCHIITGTAMESGFAGMRGYLVEDGVLYHLNVAYLEQDAEQAEALLRQWADLF